jgi:hypothetical protein
MNQFGKLPGNCQSLLERFENGLPIAGGGVRAEFLFDDVPRRRGPFSPARSMPPLLNSRRLSALSANEIRIRP